MKNFAFNKMFWGFIIILLDFPIDAGVVIHDSIPDPAGYLLILLGLNDLRRDYEFPLFEKAKWLSIVLIALPIPLLFINGFGAESLVNTSNLFWIFYGLSIEIIRIILVYLILQAMIHVANSWKNDELVNKTISFSKAFMAVGLVYILLFIVNIFAGVLPVLVITFGVALIFLVLDIMFIVRLKRFHNRM